MSETDGGLGTMTAEAKRAMLGRLLGERAGRPREAPLSAGQRRIWDLQAIDPGSPVYNVSVAHRLEGPLDADALADAVRSSSARHDVLRARVEPRPGGPVQIAPASAEVVVERLEAATEDEADAIALACAREPLDPARGRMHRFAMIRVSDRLHVLSATIHHIACDRWSLGILSREIGALYEAAASGAEAPALPAAGSYLAHAEGQGGRRGAVEAQLASWSERLGGDVPALALPGARRGATVGYRGGREAFSVDPSLFEALRALGVHEGATPSAVLLAAFAESIRRRTGQEDMVLCLPVAGRHRPEDRNAVGYFNNLVPVRLDLSGRPEFRELVGRAALASKRAYEGQDAPFQEVAALCRAPLARCVFSVQNTPGLALRLPGVEATCRDVFSGASNFDLSVFLEEGPGGGLVGLVDHKLDVVGSEEARGLAESYRSVLEGVVHDPSMRPPVASRPSPPAPAAHAPPVVAVDRPRSELERRLVELWEEATGVRPLGPGSDFFDLGGHSLAAARMFEQLSRELGIDLPLATLMAAPTPRALASAIVEEAPAWSCLVPVQPSGDRPPLYVVHGGGGGVLTYKRLAAHLGADQPVWGLQSHGRPGHGSRRVEEMAEEYVEAVVAHRPRGPYLLGGHSFGALISYEMARRLDGQGREVGLVALLDYPGPASKISWRDKLYWHRIALSQLDWGDRLAYVGSGLRWKAAGHRAMPKAAKKWILSVGRRGGRAAALARLGAFESSNEAMRGYRPPTFPGRVTLVRARGGLPAAARDSSGGWGGSALGGVEVHDIPGTHMSMFEEPHVLDLAGALRGCLDRALMARGASTGADDPGVASSTTATPRGPSASAPPG